MTSLLPANSTRAERAMERATERVDRIPVPIERLWSSADCPADLLPWLAWALSVEDWDPAWPEQIKRDVIAASFDVHSKKGTLGSIRRHLAAMGYGNASVIEFATALRLGDDLSDAALLGGGPAPPMTARNEDGQVVVLTAGIPWGPGVQWVAGQAVVTDVTDYRLKAISKGIVLHDLSHWTHYQVIVTQPIRREDAERIAASLTRVAPVRSKLIRVTTTVLIYLDEQFRLDDGWTLDSTFSLEG